MEHTDSSRPSRVRLARLFLALGLWISATSAQAAPFIEGLGTLPGQTESRAFGATADGCIVVGNSGEAFIHETNFMRKLRDSGFAAETAVAVSEGGVLSAGNNGSGMWGVEPTTAWWSLRSSVSEVPVPHQFTDASVANDMSSSGLTVVGSAAGTYGHDTFPWEAYRWTFQDGFSFLDSHPSPIASPNSPASSAEAVSSDGSIAVGWARYVGSYGTGFDDFREAVRWDGTVMTQLGFAAGATNSEATGISADGSVIVGFSDGVGFRHAGGILEEIGSIIPSDVSGDGAVIVGQLAGGTAQIWDASDGQRDLSTWLSNEHGVDLAGWSLDSVETVSDDGRTFVGNGTNPEGSIEAWRVALEGCVSEIVPLEYQDSGVAISVAVQPDDSAFAVSFYSPSQTVVIVPRKPAAPIVVVDAALDPPTLRAGPGGAFYGLNGYRNTIVRIDSDGSVETLFDLAQFAPPFDLSKFIRPEVLERWREDFPTYTPTDRIADFEVASDGSVVLTTLHSVIRIDATGSGTILLDADTAIELLGGGQYNYLSFYRILLDGDGTTYIHVENHSGSTENALLEFPPSGTPIVHRSEYYSFGNMEFSPGGELWYSTWNGMTRLGEDPFRDSPYVNGTLYISEPTEDWSHDGVRKFQILPNGELLGLARFFDSSYLVSLNPIEYVFDGSHPATVVAGPQFEGYQSSSWSFAVSDRAIYVSRGGDSILRIPQHFGTPACSDGIDNDGDGLTDWPDDPGCTVAEDEAEYQSTYACDDGVDNDGDGLTDFGGGDPGCLGPRFGNEAPQCNDGINNDPGQDALVDMDDPKCKSPGDPSESCGLGFELALILPALLAIRQRRRSKF